jgi:hypothetical protein
MDKLPRLELTHEKSSFKNNDYIIFRNQNKGKTMKSVSKNNISRKLAKKNKKNKKRSHKNRKTFFNLF